MPSLMRVDTPIAIRMIIAGFAVAGADGIAFVILMRLRPPAMSAVLLAFVLITAGYVALGLVRTMRRPRLPLEMTIAVGMIAATCLLLGMPFPPRPSSIGSDVSLSLVLILFAIVVAKPPKQSRFGYWPLALLAVLGTLMLISALMLVATHVLPPSPSVSLFFVELTIGACLVSAWHARSRSHGPVATSSRVAA